MDTAPQQEAESAFLLCALVTLQAGKDLVRPDQQQRRINSIFQIWGPPKDTYPDYKTYTPPLSKLAPSAVACICGSQMFDGGCSYPKLVSHCPACEGKQHRQLIDDWCIRRIAFKIQCSESYLEQIFAKAIMLRNAYEIHTRYA